MTATTSVMGNEALAMHVLGEALKRGVQEVILCPSTCNAPLVTALGAKTALPVMTWPEERSAAFFALGRVRRLQAPVAVVVTSGTAVGELLPAVMEAYYSGVPLLLITADRPRRFRGTGAPQVAEQVGIFGPYVSVSWDLACDETCDLSLWDAKGPAHLNVCFEEPLKHAFEGFDPIETAPFKTVSGEIGSGGPLDQFLSGVEHPLVVVNRVQPEARDAVVAFLLALNAPVYCEAVSGLREDPRIEAIQIRAIDTFWKEAPVDGVLRIGGVPTARLWRDLESRDDVAVCSITELPFRGLSRGTLIQAPLDLFFGAHKPPKSYSRDADLFESDARASERLLAKITAEPRAEPSLFCGLSHAIPAGAHVYLGNSMPIRYWDLAAGHLNRGLEVTASRGLNGIDGQISTFLGLAQPHKENWAIIGDLTALYDMAGPWVLPQLQDTRVNIVVINNGGGRIFSRIFGDRHFENEHPLTFEALAAFWGLSYERWEDIPMELTTTKSRLIEIIPDNTATDRFWSTS